jgi:hypothetical protein
VLPLVREEPAKETAVVKTANFAVTAPTPRIARLVADAAEHHRKAQALRWLGRELPAWAEPCPITVTITSRGSGGAGATSFEFTDGKVVSQAMRLDGPLDQVLGSGLPHEVTHTVLAHIFGKPLPRWADEGAALLAEDEEEQGRHARLFRTVIADNRMIPLRELLDLHDFPADVMALYAEGYSLTRFLVERKDHKTFLKFVKQGFPSHWDEALRAHYGYGSAEELEKDWLAGMKKGAGAAPARVSSRPAGPARRLPKGPPPLTALAVIEPKGRLTLRVPVACYEPQTVRIPSGHGSGQAVAVTSYMPAVKEQVQVHDLKEVKAYDADGKRLIAGALAAKLRKECPVLVSANGEKVDPFYLQLVKEGTVILVVPPSPAPVVPPAPRAM